MNEMLKTIEYLTFLEGFLTENRKSKFLEILQLRTQHFTVAIEDVFQMHNTSAVMRSCEVFGVQEVHVVEQKYGKKIDTENSGKLMKIPGGVYQSIIDLYLDEDDWGDMTDPKKGYDIKITRTGKTKNDTEYSVAPCKNTPLDKDWAKKTIDLKAMAKSLVEPYDVVKGKLNEFLGIDDEDEDEDKPRKKSKKAKDDFSTAKKKKSVKTGKKVLTKKKK